ncbi:hypothetical protein Enr13x_54210 [Stieleria neptunia]|uniref:Uncharacterized protein n=1 Tax=Stieleria neptunia TaxID=2527979 RepID=A0A518HXF5_9BACT|nr:hypothetical protein [Stieleria neptunia]QDV45542.1 hypothetical protein Enr13x_54210 [Stieleria neptunia]
MATHLMNVPQRFGYLFCLPLFCLPAAAVKPLVVITLALAAISCSAPPTHAQTEGDGYEGEMDMEMDMYEGYEDEMNMDMDMDMGYGYGSSGPGGRSRSGRGMATQDLVASRLSEYLTSAFESTSFATLADPAAAPPVQSGPVLLNDAIVAYAKGQHELAMRLYFGHIVAEYESAQNQLQLVKYSSLMKRPTWQLRWGISYAVRGDATDPQPIGDVNPAGRGGFDGGFGDGGMEGMEEEYAMEQEFGGPGGGRGPAGRGPAGARGPGMGDTDGMEYMEGMDEMYEQDMMMMGSGRARGRAAAPAGPPTPAARLAALDATMLSEEAETSLTNTLGMVATILGEEFDKRYTQGDFGRAMTDVTAESGSVETVSEEFVELIETAGDALPLWRPGIVFLGEGDSSDNIRRAQKAGLDLVIHFDVLLKPLRGEYTQNISLCRLFHVPTGKSLGASKKIDSLEFAQKSRLKNLASRDYINEQLANFLGIIDRGTLTTELPALTPAIASKRIGSLLASGGGANLRTLAEVRLFQSQQLLNEEEVLTAFDIVGGEEALGLIYGSEEERLRIVRQWAAGRTGDAE